MTKEEKLLIKIQIDNNRIDNAGQNKMHATFLNDVLGNKLKEYGAPKTNSCFCSASIYNNYITEFKTWFAEFLEQE